MIKITPYKLRWLLNIRQRVLSARRWYLVTFFGMDLHPTCSLSLKAKLDMNNPAAVHIGAESYVAFNATILTHDMTRGLRADTYIGRRCFIGAGAMILPGIRVGDGSIVGAGSIVTHDVPPGSIVAGNPARVIRAGIHTTRYGCINGTGYLAPRIVAA
jgi:acetyltransferase-like isoleucine patch superfamily enzyme